MILIKTKKSNTLAQIEKYGNFVLQLKTNQNTETLRKRPNLYMDTHARVNNLRFDVKLMTQILIGQTNRKVLLNSETLFTLFGEIVQILNRFFLAINFKHLFDDKPKRITPL